MHRQRVYHQQGQSVDTLGAGLPPADSLEAAAAFAATRPGPATGQPPFLGGAVGFLTYDWVTQS